MLRIPDVAATAAGWKGTLEIKQFTPCFCIFLSLARLPYDKCGGGLRTGPAAKMLMAVKESL